MNIQKALVVDDSRVAHVLLNKLLKERGIEVDWVGSGNEALGYLKSQKTDIVFIDVMMPGMDGFETADTITKDPTIYAPPIIMCSANATDEDQENATKCGANAFLSKPYTPDELDQILHMIRELPAVTEEPERVEVVETVEPIEFEEPTDLASTDDGQPEPVESSANTEEALPSIEEPPPISIDTGTVTQPLSSKEVSDIARKVAAQAVQSATEEAVQTTVPAIVQQLLAEAQTNITTQATQAAKKTAQTSAVEAARAVAKQAMRIVAEKVPNAETLRKGLANNLQTQVAENVQHLLDSDDFKHHIAKLVQESAKPAVESMAQQIAENARQAAHQTAEEVALSVAEETVKSGSQSSAKLAYIGIGLGFVAIILAAAFKFVL